MPKTERTPPKEKELAAAIREDFGGTFYLTLAQVGKIIGARSPHTAREWASTLSPQWRNGRKVWMVADVAHKMLNSQEGREAV